MAIDTPTKLIAAIAGQNRVPYMKNALGGTLVAGRPYGLMTTAGSPGAMTVPTTLAGSNTNGTSLAGALPYINAAGGTQKYIGGVNIGLNPSTTASTGGSIHFYDMVWWNGGITATLTTALTIDSAAFPARDRNGSVSGEGYIPWVFVSGTMGAGTPTLTLSYTNTDGTTGRTATCVAIATAVSGTMIPFALQTGDTGVQSIQTLTQSATWTSGTYHIVVMRYICSVSAPVGTTQSLNWYDLGNDLFDGTCIVGQLTPNGTTSLGTLGAITLLEG